MEFSRELCWNRFWVLVFLEKHQPRWKLKQLLSSFQDAMDQKPHGAMLFVPIADTIMGPWVTRAALRAQESNEALVQDCSDRIASTLATAVRPKAGIKLRKTQNTHSLLLYPSMHDRVQMFKELKDELADLLDAYDADEHVTNERLGVCATSCCLTAIYVNGGIYKNTPRPDRMQPIGSYVSRGAGCHDNGDLVLYGAPLHIKE
eukprot:4598040-Pleurochrysis_carterae.AAC.2